MVTVVVVVVVTRLKIALPFIDNLFVSKTYAGIDYVFVPKTSAGIALKGSYSNKF